MPAPLIANDTLHEALASVAPGTGLRDGIDRIVRAKMGALLVLADTPDVLAICAGGFDLQTEFTPQRLSELAKMDGAIIISSGGQHIVKANVHLVPDPTVPSSETGTRHRTAERVAASLGVPVVSVSEEMSVINLYAGGTRRQLQDVSRLLNRADQALQTLERYQHKLDDALSELTTLEIEDVVTVRDVSNVLGRGQMVRQIAAEIETMIVELGVDARLLRLQLDEVFESLDDELSQVQMDYPAIAHGAKLAPDTPATPRGVRILTRVPRLNTESAKRIADHFGDLAKLLRATAPEIASVTGIDLATAHAVKDTLHRITEASILDQYI